MLLLSLQGLGFGQALARCEMSGVQKDDDVNQTPEYPLPSPTDPLGRDELPLEDEDAEE